MSRLESNFNYFYKGLTFCGLFFYLAFFFISFSSFAILENQNFANEYEKKVLPLYTKSLRAPLVLKSSLKLNYLHYKEGDPRKVLLILPGKSESASKYAEVAYDLREEFEIFILDHRNQGGSTRQAHLRDLIHVEDFNHYVDDVEFFVKKVLALNLKGRKAFLLAHSMGAMIGTLYLARDQKTFTKAVLNSPMLSLKMNGIPRWLSAFILNLFPRDSYAFTQSSYNWKARGKESRMTSSLLRWNANHNFLLKNRQLASNGVSNGWLLEVLKITNPKKLRKTASKISTKILMFSAGKDDIINSEGQRSFCSKLASCTFFTFSEALHEILNEKDEFRLEALKKIGHFLN